MIITFHISEMDPYKVKSLKVLWLSSHPKILPPTYTIAPEAILQYTNIPMFNKKTKGRMNFKDLGTLGCFAKEHFSKIIEESEGGLSIVREAY